MYHYVALVNERSLFLIVVIGVPLPQVGGGMSFTLYLVGFIVLIAGLAFGANMMHVAPRWIAAGAIVLTGLGIVTGVARTRQRDP